ncbi:MAG: glycosyltransferase family 39 protein, partial [Dehalococcoidia bacterium]|nr:glycosyltransferase family 39 protein [Dehalococcoidia bacterium]
MTALSRAIAAGTDGARVCPRWLVLTLAGIGFLVLWGLPTIIIPLATDQVLNALGARTILDGGQLYRDYWEIKPPLVFLIYTIPFAIAGEHMEAIRVLDLINTALAMGAVFLLSRRLFNERAAVFAAGFYGFS